MISLSVSPGDSLRSATICSGSVFIKRIGFLREPATENTTGEIAATLASGFEALVEVLKALGTPAGGTKCTVLAAKASWEMF